MLPDKLKTQNKEVGFPMPAESGRLPPAIRAINAVVVVLLAAIGFWICYQLEIWNIASGTVFSPFVHKAWGALPVIFAIVPVIAYSLPLQKLLERRRQLAMAKEMKKITKQD